MFSADKFTRVSILLTLGFVTSCAASAQVNPAHHDLCKQAQDYLGCIKAMTGAAAGKTGAPTAININQTNRPGLLSEMGNSCPSGWAYAGGGRCRSTKCQPMGIFGKNQPELSGKGISCQGKNLEYGMLSGRASLRWGNDYMDASNDPKCPPYEPRHGDPNSCVTARLTGKVIHTGVIRFGDGHPTPYLVKDCSGTCKTENLDVLPGDRLVSLNVIPYENIAPNTFFADGESVTYVLERNGRKHTVVTKAKTQVLIAYKGPITSGVTGSSGSSDWEVDDDD